MRFVLREQSQTEFVVVMEGPTVGRIHYEAGKWHWALNAPICAEGSADHPEIAKEELRQR